MNKHAVLIGLSTILLTTGIAAAQDDSIRGVTAASYKAPLSSWTPAQQYVIRSDYGYTDWDGHLALADELGDRLSHLGRAAIVVRCFTSREEPKYQLARWALCRTDFAALDLQKAEAELVAAGVEPDEIKFVMGNVTKAYEAAKVVVAQFDEEAKRDKGLQKLLTDVEAAKKEWADYSAAHRAELELYFKLRDAARSGKRNDPGFDGCEALTRPRFEKHVRSVGKKIPYETSGLPGYMWYLVESTDGYLTTASWAACGISVHPAMDAAYAEAVTLDFVRIRHGWRSFAIAKLGADGYKPRFADSSYNTGSVGSRYLLLPGVSKSASNSYSGDIKKLTRQDDEMRIAFKMDVAEGVCLRWVERRGEKHCAERGDVDNELGDDTVPAAYAGGMKPNVSVQLQAGLPVVVYDAKKKKLLAIFGVALK